MTDRLQDDLVKGIGMDQHILSMTIRRLRESLKAHPWSAREYDGDQLQSDLTELSGLIGDVSFGRARMDREEAREAA